MRLACSHESKAWVLATSSPEPACRARAAEGFTAIFPAPAPKNGPQKNGALSTRYGPTRISPGSKPPLSVVFDPAGIRGIGGVLRHGSVVREKRARGMGAHRAPPRGLQPSTHVQKEKSP